MSLIASLGIPYRDGLRAVGGLFDQRGLEGLRLVDDGATVVVYGRAPASAEIITPLFLKAADLQRHVGRAHARRRSGPLTLRLLGLDAAEAGATYQNLLRAVGTRLDAAGLHLLDLAEDDDGLSLRARDPAAPAAPPQVHRFTASDLRILLIAQPAARRP